MMVWSVNNDINTLINEVKEKHHHPRLAEAKIAAAFCDSKPFIGGRFNWGKTAKFSTLAKLWHPEDKKYDFLITLCADAWHGLLNAEQREALVDLRLTCCQVEYEKVMEEINGKSKPVKDEWGRIQYTDVIKTDEDGAPKWKVGKLDLNVFQDNVLRYGCWTQDLLDFSEVCDKVKHEKS